jgi:hypothetical protein
VHRVHPGRRRFGVPPACRPEQMVLLRRRPSELQLPPPELWRRPPMRSLRTIKEESSRACLGQQKCPLETPLHPNGCPDFLCVSVGRSKRIKSNIFEHLNGSDR